MQNNGSSKRAFFYLGVGKKRVFPRARVYPRMETLKKRLSHAGIIQEYAGDAAQGV
jgi:hypothetical protein